MKSVKITPPEGFEIDNDKSTFEEIVFKPIKSKYPLSVMELDNNSGWFVNNQSMVNYRCNLEKRDCLDNNLVSTKERAEAILALIQLVELRDAWNKIDGFVADWGNIEQDKHVIHIECNEIETTFYSEAYEVLYFGSRKTRDLFLETHRNLIETAKEFI